MSSEMTDIEKQIDDIKNRAKAKFKNDHDDGDLAIYDVVHEMTDLITSQKAIWEKGAMELLFWKYKELNHQSVDKKFAEAYGILMDELSTEDEKES